MDLIIDGKPYVVGVDLNHETEPGDVYTDEVGGHHDCGIGWNPNGIWCGECTKGTCKGCINEHLTEEIF